MLSEDMLKSVPEIWSTVPTDIRKHYPLIGGTLVRDWASRVKRLEEDVKDYANSLDQFRKENEHFRKVSNEILDAFIAENASQAKAIANLCRLLAHGIT